MSSLNALQSDPRIIGERQCQRLLIAFLISGLIFMLLPGTFLGVWNLIGISSHRAVTALSPAWLPAFGGMRVLWSSELMFWSLALLTLGCFLRVSMEPLAYELDWPIAWKLLPVSAVIELTAVTIFALNLIGTLLTQPPHLRDASDGISGGTGRV